MAMFGLIDEVLEFGTRFFYRQTSTCVHMMKINYIKLTDIAENLLASNEVSNLGIRR
jgi:hypothetical protein